MQDHFGKIPQSPRAAFPSKTVVHCAEFILTVRLLTVRKGLCCDPGHCRIYHLARMVSSYSCCSLASSEHCLHSPEMLLMHMDCRIDAGS